MCTTDYRNDTERWVGPGGLVSSRQQLSSKPARQFIARCPARQSGTYSSARQSGATLLELVLFIIIVSIGVIGILAVYTNTVRYSADPVVRKQMLSIAEAMLEETTLMPFTYCDPDDVDAATAGAAVVGPGNCAATVEGIGAEPGETRYSLVTPFDNVNDYHDFNTATAIPSGIRDIGATPISGLTGYSAEVSASAQDLGPAAGLIAALDGNARPQVLLVTVTVTAPDGDELSLSGYRTRYAPNAVP